MDRSNTFWQTIDCIAHSSLGMRYILLCLRYRLIAFDHDLLSFADVTLDEWPLVLVTNPKDAHFMVPSREPVGRMRHSTHVQ